MEKKNHPSYHRHQHLECPSRRLENIAEEGEGQPALELPSPAQPPETPTETMEFLARSWSLSASELSRALTDVVLPPPPPPLENLLLPVAAAAREKQQLDSHNNFAAAQTDHKRTPGPVPAAEPLGHSPPISPRDYGELKLLRGVPRGKTMGGWLRDLKERRKEETRAHHAQVYAATSVAGVAAAVAGIAAGTVFTVPLQASALPPSDGASKTNAVVASAAALVASHCVDMARAMGATRDQILTVIQSAVNARTTGDIMALTAGAATALRGAATLRARLCKDTSGEASAAESFETKGSTSAVSFVSKGGELLKRTRKGDLHWKQVSISMNSNWQVVLKMRCTHIAGSFVKTKKSKIDRWLELCHLDQPLSRIIQSEWCLPGVVREVCSNIAAWPGREAEDRTSQRAYFGIRTPERLIEFECRNKYEKEIWADGIQQILDCQANMNIATTM